MKRTTFPALALTLTLAACSSLPAGDSDIDALLAISGLQAQMDWLRQPLQPDQAKGPMALVPDEWITLVNSAVAETLKPADLRESLRDALKANLSARELAEVRRFYESDTGRQVVATESGRLDRRLAPTGSDDPTLDALAETTGVGKAVSLLAQNALGDAVDIALKNGCLGHERTPFASLVGGVMKKAQLLALRHAVNTRVRERYAALNTDEQNAYLKFARSNAGQKFFAARTRVMTDAAQRTGAALGAQLTPHISEVCKSST